MGLVYDSTGYVSITNCTNTGALTGRETNLATSATNRRFNIGGIAAAMDGMVTDCTNSGTLIYSSQRGDGNDASYYPQNALSYLGGIVGSGYYAAGQDNLIISDCVNTGDIYLRSAANRYNSALGGIVGWPNDEIDLSTSRISACTSSGNIVENGFALVRIGGISGGSGRVESCTFRGNIISYHRKAMKYYPSNLSPAASNAGTGSVYMGGIMGVKHFADGHGATDCIVEGATLRYALNEATDGSGDETIPGNRLIFGIGGIFGGLLDPGNLDPVIDDMTVAEGCTIHCSIESNHPRDLGYICGRISDLTKVLHYQFGSSSKPITVKGGSRISYSYKSSAGGAYIPYSASVSSSEDLKLYSADSMSTWSYAWNSDTSTGTYNYKDSAKMGCLIGGLRSLSSSQYDKYVGFAAGSEITSTTEGLSNGGNLF